MDHISEFFQSSQATGLAIAVIIFLITVLLAARRTIGLTFTFALLMMAAATGVFIGRCHFDQEKSQAHSFQNEEEIADFKEQLVQAIDNLNSELNQERESLKKVTQGMQSLLSQMDTQKQKLQSFIEETRERFNKITTNDLPAQEDSSE